MKKTIIGALKKTTEDSLDSIPMELLGLDEGESRNSNTGETEKFVRVEAEIPRGYGVFSRCQLSVKVPNGKIRITDEDLENADYIVIFDNLTVTYIDSKAVYFRADSYTVQKNE